MQRGEVWWASLPEPAGSGPGYRRPVLPRRGAGLSRDSVVNVSQLLTLDKTLLTERIGRVPPAKLRELDGGLRLVLAL